MILVALVGLTLVFSLHVMLVQAKTENIREFKFGAEKDAPTMVSTAREP